MIDLKFIRPQIRHYAPWLQNGRWYASNQILPDGTQIVVGGRGVKTVEYVPANGRGTYTLPLLAKVRKSSSIPHSSFQNRSRIIYPTPILT
jgi:hypothetical protein